MSNTKRIAKNTVVLYIRMVIVMLISLYTSRIVLKALGVSDFGLYNVVGGVVGLFGFLRVTIAGASQRFMNYEMVKEDGDVKSVFRSCWTIHIFITLIVIFLAETVGLWFLNTKVNIPEGREFAANLIYQTTIASLCATIISIPLSAVIVAHENFKIYAFLSVFETLLKLGIAFLIMADNGDRLILYGILIMFASFLHFFIYLLYSAKKYSEVCLRILLDRGRFREIFSFVGWSMVGQIAIVGCNQGNSLLVNMFHSVIANAAMTIGIQVNGAVVSLSSNFQAAFKPQITQSFARNDFNYLKYLVYTTSKISYCLLFVVAIPIMVNIDFILDLWLEEVPVYSNIFCVLYLVNGILNALSEPLSFSIAASGRIKWFQITTAIVYLSDLIILYFLFRMGLPPATAMWVKVSIMVVILFVRLYFSNNEVPSITINSYFKHVLAPLLIVSIPCVALAIVLSAFFDSLILRLVLTTVIFAFNICLVWYVALSKSERNSLLTMIKGKMKRK